METLISIPDLFKKSFEIYKPRLWTMLLLGLLGWLVSMVVVAVFGGAGAITFFAGGQVLTFNLLAVLLALVGALLVIIANLWIHVAIIYSIKEEHVSSGVKELLMAVKDKLVSYYWVCFLQGLIIAIGFILFVIPGIIFSIWFGLGTYVFVFEGQKGMNALSRSRELVRGYWWPVFGRLLLLFGITILISLASEIGFLINSLFTAPFGVVYAYVIYQDLKRVKA